VEGYTPLDGFDMSFLPLEFDVDEVMPLDDSEHMCYNCSEQADVYNITVGRYECEEHAGDRKKEM
jgi:hypothetical protein